MIMKLQKEQQQTLKLQFEMKQAERKTFKLRKI